MNRTICYTAQDTQAGMTIRSFLMQRGYSGQNLKGLKSHAQGILYNGTPVCVNQKLQMGDVLTINIQEEASSGKLSPVCLPLDIIYEDEDLLIVNKSSNMPIHPSVNNHNNSLANGAAWYYRNQDSPFIFRCINRLDRDTSGLTIIAKHPVSAGILSSMAARRELHREYLGIIRGKITPEWGTINAPIAREEGSILKRTVDYEIGEKAVTHYKMLSLVPEKALFPCPSDSGIRLASYSLVSLELETGRTHQIRVHLKHIGFPLIGDYLYNPDMEDIKRQALHSFRLEFTHPVTGQAMQFTAPLPSDMSRIIS